jgi:hypothetical protein
MNEQLDRTRALEIAIAMTKATGDDISTDEVGNIIMSPKLFSTTKNILRFISDGKFDNADSSCNIKFFPRDS